MEGINHGRSQVELSEHSKPSPPLSLNWHEKKRNKALFCTIYSLAFAIWPPWHIALSLTRKKYSSCCSGYMSPEYAMRGHYSIKSDVFSFGVLILEILTGRRSSGSINIEQSVDLLSLVSHSTIPKLYTQVICFKNANGINI